VTRAGELNHRIAFDKRSEVNPDSPADLGNTRSEFVEQFRVFARVRAKFGGEAVTAARLIGQQPVTITVRQNSLTEQIETDWRARDVNEGTEYAIRSIVDPDDEGAWFEILAQTGVAA
jgi:head-tail adaptor